MKTILQIITNPTSNFNKQIDHSKTTFHNFNTLPTYKYIHFKTTFMCPRSIAGVPSSQALPGFLITAPPSVLVPAVLGALAVWIQNQKTKKGTELPSKEDTSSEGKGGGQQKWHSNATMESTVPGTRLIVTSCPPITSCWWRDKSLPSLTSACRWFGHDEIIWRQEDVLCPYGWTGVVVRRGQGIGSHIGRRVRHGHLKGPGPNRT